MGPPAALASAGRLLYGDEWQSPLAAELGALRRQVARWAAGDRAPPPDLWPWLRQRLADQAAALAGLMAAMAPPPPITPPHPAHFKTKTDTPLTSKPKWRGGKNEIARHRGAPNA